MRRSDGVRLLYPGKVHSLHGESESAKSLIAQAECVRVIKSGGRVLFLDFESDAVSVIGRLLGMGATAEIILKRFKYVRPEFDPETFGEAEEEAFQRHLGGVYDLIVIDGVTAAFDVYGLNSMDNGDTMKWGRKLPLRLASKTGAAVILIDHVTKSSDGRGRFALGAQMKMSFLTGAAYTARMTQQLAVGRVGKIEIRVGKDREGLVRSHSTDFRSSDQTAAIAVAVFDSTQPSKLLYSLEAPSGHTLIRSDDEISGLPRAVLDVLSTETGGVGMKTICANSKPRKLAPSTAKRHVDNLVAMGFIAEAKPLTPENPGRAALYQITAEGTALLA
ncbi:AAA family ATPase [Arthrobacter sp. H35-D1]|uniref:AAA family ATPase n=1 Tax=Arthrobacter sp. H35-D1 TaxID=3046202 RepID=UPI0024BB767B|nr:AAA family ATPase [Arthrobacter sp. H35-D1]MDJ0315070.1 AAA family ATPase [Arthrobacter sp. H35-D1]